MIFRVNPYNKFIKHDSSWHKTYSFTHPPHLTSSRRKHNPLLDDQTMVDLPNDPCIPPNVSTNICRLCNSWWQDWIKLSSLRAPPCYLFCAFNVSHGTHCKQHVGILLCLLSNTWIHNMSAFFKWIAWSCLNVMVLQSLLTSSSSVVWA